MFPPTFAPKQDIAHHIAYSLMYVMLECGIYVQGINTIVYGVSQMLLGRFHVGLQGWIDDGFCGDFRASTGL